MDVIILNFLIIVIIITIFIIIITLQASLFTSTIKAVPNVSIHTRALVQTNVIGTKSISITNINSQFAFVNIWKAQKIRLLDLSETVAFYGVMKRELVFSRYEAFLTYLYSGNMEDEWLSDWIIATIIFISK